MRRITCKNMDHRFEAEGYSSHNGPEEKGVKGYTIKGMKSQKVKAEATSWRRSLRGEPV
jgi:hypothetical protein